VGVGEDVRRGERRIFPMAAYALSVSFTISMNCFSRPISLIARGTVTPSAGS